MRSRTGCRAVYLLEQGEPTRLTRPPELREFGLFALELGVPLRKRHCRRGRRGRRCTRGDGGGRRGRRHRGPASRLDRTSLSQMARRTGGVAVLRAHEAQRSSAAVSSREQTKQTRVSTRPLATLR
ncbi:hypothetical protein CAUPRSCDRAFT_12357 [Caulochytrium protostelioides]|uniref:Uncharacterized protein n=1 Tax=Caulochytrium protostelioides TaxID=1555241 RepID=A0A4P9WTE1_9FUNG|nr:hypothetical protein CAUPRSCDRAFT_12357 [Caulochytrium protostelioides]